MNEIIISENELRKFYDGDEEIFEAIIRTYAGEIIGYCNLYLHNRVKSEDIAQEVLLKVYEQRKTFRRNENFKAWLFTIVRNTLIDTLRREQREIRLFSQGDNSQNYAENSGNLSQEQIRPDAKLEKQELRRILDEALQQLSPDEAEIIIHRYLLQLSIKEITSILHIPQGTVGVKIQRALKKLHKYFSEKNLTFYDLV